MLGHCPHLLYVLVTNYRLGVSVCVCRCVFGLFEVHSSTAWRSLVYDCWLCFRQKMEWLGLVFFLYTVSGHLSLVSSASNSLYGKYSPFLYPFRLVVSSYIYCTLSYQSTNSSSETIEKTYWTEDRYISRRLWLANPMSFLSWFPFQIYFFPFSRCLYFFFLPASILFVDCYIILFFF